MKREVKLTKPYKLLFEELSKDIYHTWGVYDYFVNESMHPNDKRANVIMRIDVDFGLHLCPTLAIILKEKGINASFYFLTFPSRYYNIWKSDIPKIVSDMGFEVGLHSDHYYEQLMYGKDAIEGIKRDVKKISDLMGKPVYGMVYHGHKEINALGKTNWDVYKSSRPEDLGLIYHDGYLSPYTKSESDVWRPNTDYPVLTDFMEVRGGWKYCPYYPIKTLRRVKRGESINICIHPHNAFEYWKNWDYSYNEKMPERDSLIESLINFWKIKYVLMIEYLMNYPRIYYLLREVKKWTKKLM